MQIELNQFLMKLNFDVRNKHLYIHLNVQSVNHCSTLGINRPLPCATTTCRLYCVRNLHSK